MSRVHKVITANNSVHPEEKSCALCLVLFSFVLCVGVGEGKSCFSYDNSALEMQSFGKFCLLGR